MEDYSASAYYHHPPPPSYYPSYYPPPPVPGAAPPAPPPPQQQPPPQPLPYYPPHQQHHHQPPPPQSHPHFGASYSLPPPIEPPQDEVRTLFIAGLPDDVKPRETFNLFREFPGFQSSQLRSAGESTRAYAFAVFVDQQSAVTAMHALNGLVFDLEKESTLYVNLAKSNSRSKRTRTDEGVPYSPDKKIRSTGAYSRGYLDSGVGSNIHMPGMGNSAYSMNGYPSAPSHSIFDYRSTDPNKLNNASKTYVSQDTPPCPTLFVANLGPTCSEQELTQVFSRCPGFLKLKMQNKNGVHVAFVDFQDTACSTGALHHLQGTTLYSSVGEGMRLEYAKARMGLRRREKKT